MYAYIVEKIVRHAFRQLNARNASAIPTLFAPDARLTFPGTSQLGQTCEGREQIVAWFDRLFATLPTLSFEVQDVNVRGFPWNTRVLTRFIDRVVLRDGSTVLNHGVQFLRIRWGKVIEDELFLDTQIVERACAGCAGAASPLPA